MIRGLTSHDLYRALEEDISIHPDGIWDFGTEESKTPIDLVKEHRGVDAKNAAFWLCEQLCIDPATLGWNGRTADRPHQNSQVPDISMLLKSLGMRTNDQDVETGRIQNDQGFDSAGLLGHDRNQNGQGVDSERNKNGQAIDNAGGHGRPNLQAPDIAANLARESQFYSAASLKEKPIPPREWLVHGLVPQKTVTLFSGDGGTGKNLLALQLAVAVAAQTAWIGKTINTGRVIFLSAEDDDDELHRRLDDILKAEGRGYDDLSGLTVHDTKNGSDHYIPISRLIKGVLERQKAFLENNDKADCPWVFPARRGEGHMTEPKSQLKKICDATGVQFSFHDLRRTFATHANANGIPHEEIKRALNHKSGDVTAGYIITKIDSLRPVFDAVADGYHRYYDPDWEHEEAVERAL